VTYVGSTLGSIRIESQLGQGGMGDVYLGYDPRLDRRVAVKTIRREHRLSSRHKARFLREARLLSKIGHPSICQVYDLVETPEADFLVLEYVPGTNLRELAKQEELSFGRKLELAEKIALALAVAHREQIVHRDLKADNVMVTPEGAVKVLDFGVARSLSEPAARLGIPPPPPLPSLSDPDEEETRELGPASSTGDSGLWTEEDPGLTSHGMVVGTIYAMSPEQASGGQVTEASDLYSFGVLLQELFTGAPAYEAEDDTDLLWQVVRAQTRPITGLDPDLTRLIHDLESPDPRRRPTAEDTAERLRWILDRPQRLRRRRLRFAAVVGAFALLLAVLAVVSWLAVAAERARREADQRRRQAESLIGFMLGDLRKKLEAVDRLDVLDSVGDRALAYFDELPESQLTDQELARRIQAIQQIGEVRYAQGNLPAAFQAFRRSYALARELAARKPSDATLQDHLSSSQDWLGQVLYDQGRPQEALALWKESRDLARAGLAASPGDPAWLKRLSTADHNIGTLLDFRGDLDGALQSYRESLTLERQIAAQEPKDREIQAQMAATLAWISNALERQGDLKGALEERRAHLAIHERLAALEPGDPNRQLDLATARGFVAGLLAVLGEREEAHALYRSGLATVEDLAAQDPENAIRRRWLGAFHSALGLLTAEEGDPTQARALLGKARTVFEPLMEGDPTNDDYRLQVGVCRSRTAFALERLDPARARTEARAAVEILTPLLEGDLSEPTRGLIAEAEVRLGRLEDALGNRAAARAAWERALATLEPCARPMTHWKVLSPWAQALLALDRLDEARPAVERLRAMGYQSPPLSVLCREKGLLPEQLDDLGRGR
jgi:eukaryotic-like serine/threonine-protein kinase